MRIRPARLAAILLGKRQDSPFSKLETKDVLRLLRISGAFTEELMEDALNSGGSILWLEDFLDNEESRRKSEDNYINIIDRILKTLLEDPGFIYWKTCDNQKDTDVKLYIERTVLESGWVLSEQYSIVPDVGRMERASTNYYAPVYNMPHSMNPSIASGSNAQAATTWGSNSPITQSIENQSIFNTKRLLLAKALEALIEENEKNMDNLVKAEYKRLLEELSNNPPETPEKTKRFLEKLAGVLASSASIVGTTASIAEGVRKIAQVSWPMLEKAVSGHPEILDQIRSLM